MSSRRFSFSGQSLSPPDKGDRTANAFSFHDPPVLLIEYIVRSILFLHNKKQTLSYGCDFCSPKPAIKVGVGGTIR